MGDDCDVDAVNEEAEQRYREVVAAGDRLVVGLDFDGTLAPIVDDPEQATIHPGGPDVLLRLAAAVRAVAVITGRPARQVLALGGLDDLGNAAGEQGRSLIVLGQYGNERWTSQERRVISPKPPGGLSTMLGELPGVLRRYDAADAHVEEKGLAIGVHTRRLEDPQGTFERLLGPITQLAERFNMTVEPGKYVIEVRAPGMDKGAAVRRLVEELDAGGFVFIGDDLGDLEAFKAVQELRDEGLPGLLVCSHSREESALLELADAEVSGPDGVLEFLTRLSVDLESATA